jgi:hypothetical protein
LSNHVKSGFPHARALAAADAGYDSVLFATRHSGESNNDLADRRA